MTDLVERLLKREHYFLNAVEGEYDATLLRKARFEIEALSERIAVLEGALEPIVAKFHNVANSTGVTGITLVGVPVADLRKADASLTPDLSQ
jgi:hypothetical protein